MTPAPTRSEITFHADNAACDPHPAIDIKCHNWPQDLGDDLTEIDGQCIWERTQEEWHEEAVKVAHSYGYSGYFTEGRSGGWLVPFRQTDAAGMFKQFGGGNERWSSQGPVSGYPVYPDATEAAEQETFVAFRAEIVALLTMVPDMARTNAALYREDMKDAKAEAATACEGCGHSGCPTTERRAELAERLKGIGRKANAERFDLLGEEARAGDRVMTERRILEVYAGAVRGVGAADTVAAFRVVTYCERDGVKAFGKYVPCSLKLVGDAVNLETALDMAVLEAKEAPEFDEVRFTGLEETILPVLQEAQGD